MQQGWRGAHHGVAGHLMMLQALLQMLMSQSLGGVWSAVCQVFCASSHLTVVIRPCSIAIRVKKQIQKVVERTGRRWGSAALRGCCRRRPGTLEAPRCCGWATAATARRRHPAGCKSARCRLRKAAQPALEAGPQRCFGGHRHGCLHAAAERKQSSTPHIQ